MMTPARVQNLLVYCGVGLLNILGLSTAAAMAAGSMPGFRDGEFFRPSQPEAIALLTIVLPIFSTWLAAHQPSWGGEGLAAQANVYRDQGVHRDDMVVLPRDQAALAVASPSIQLDPGMVQQMVAAVKAEMVRDPAGVDPLISSPPAWLPPAPADAGKEA